MCDVKDAGIPCIIEPSLQLRLDTSAKSEIRIKKNILINLTRKGKESEYQELFDHFSKYLLTNECVLEEMLD